jgi:hypothetical protein
MHLTLNRDQLRLQALKRHDVIDLGADAYPDPLAPAVVVVAGHVCHDG